MWRPDNHYFEVKPPAPANGGWGVPVVPVEYPKPEWHSDIEKKKAFGTRLGKGDKPLDAAMFVFGQQSDALWAIANWLRDPIVVETRETVEQTINLLDKDQLSAKLLRFAEERSAQGFPLHESKDRIAAYKLYAEIQGFVGKVNIDASQKTFHNNSMQITLVEAEPEKDSEVIEHRKSTIENLDNALEVNLKLVG